MTASRSHSDSAMRQSYSDAVSGLLPSEYFSLCSMAPRIASVESEVIGSLFRLSPWDARAPRVQDVG